MPELAEVEYFRKQWDSGIGQKVTRVHIHEGKRIFRGTDLEALGRLAGQKLLSSEAAGKQMLFCFNKGSWLGIHLGMTGKLSAAGPQYIPGKHDHLAFFQKHGALVFTDARQFGRVQIHEGKEAPLWWTRIGPAVTAPEFTFAQMNAFLERRARLPVKGALLVQKGFPGIGNWMADETLWRAEVLPHRPCATLSEPERKKLWREVRTVARGALEKIGSDFSDPPKGWLFHERWGNKGCCPKHRIPLERGTIAGRTTAWCPKCQR